MVRLFVFASIVYVPICVQEFSVKMPDNETVVMMKIDIKTRNWRCPRTG